MIRQNSNLTQQVLQAQGSQSRKKFRVILDFVKTISTFKGEEGPLEAKIWLEQVEAVARTNEWPDSFTLQTAESQLKGAAQSRYRGFQGDLHD